VPSKGNPLQPFTLPLTQIGKEAEGQGMVRNPSASNNFTEFPAAGKN